MRAVANILIAIGISLLVACSAGQPVPPDDFIQRQLSELKELPVPDGVSAATWQQLKDGLADVLRARLASGVVKTASSPPTTNGSRPIAVYEGTGSKLSWGYYSTGDYDQNGLVTISDLTPLGVHLGQSVSGEDSVEAVVDGDGNGLITIADLTPLGANLGVQVSGYNIYTSLDSADAPRHNIDPSTIAEFGSVVLAEATGSPVAGRRQFSFTVATPLPLARYWVRPTDGTSEGTRSNLAMAAIGPIDLDSGDTGYQTSMVIVNGNPAIAYVDLTNTRLRYVRASNPAGTAWGTPVTLADYITDSGSLPWLAIVDGFPAVAYLDPDPFTVHYVRAQDEDGSAWGLPQEIGTAGEGAGYLCLAVVNGNPAVTYFAYGIDKLRYVRSSDAQGTVWSTPQDIVEVGADPLGPQEGPSMQTVDGNPAIAYFNYASGSHLEYIRARDPDGATWGAPVAPDTATESGQFTDLVVIEGRPAISYHTYLGGLWYVRAQDTQGLAWGVPRQIDTLETTGFTTSMAVIDGYPAIACYDFSTGNLRYIQARDKGGAQWGVSEVLIAGGCAFPTLIEISGVPAVGYFSSGNLSYLAGF